MARPSRHEYFLNMLQLVASRSTCLRRSVAAILTDEEGHILSTGYNGVPRGILHCGETAPGGMIVPDSYAGCEPHMVRITCLGAKDPSGDTRRCLAVHAEQNALLQCTDLERAHTLYVSCTPCFVCAKMIANTKIRTVVCAEPYADKDGMRILEACGVAVIHVQ